MTEAYVDLKDKIALVTGASRGIGQAIATALAEQGAIVAGTATSEEGAEKITAMLKEQGAKGQGFVMKLQDKESIAQGHKAVVETLGAPLVLINNAGVTRDNLMLRMKDTEWEDTIAVNLTGTFQLTKLCLRDMMKERFGRVINLSSVTPFMGNPGQANYAASKMGVVGFTRSLANELGSRNITCNAVAPGFIETDMTKDINEKHMEKLVSSIPLGRVGKPSDIADVVLFLSSDKANYITGQTFHVNGGMYMS